jgi:hypothetical protein
VESLPTVINTETQFRHAFALHRRSLRGFSLLNRVSQVNPMWLLIFFNKQSVLIILSGVSVQRLLCLFALFRAQLAQVARKRQE